MWNKDLPLEEGLYWLYGNIWPELISENHIQFPYLSIIAVRKDKFEDLFLYRDVVKGMYVEPEDISGVFQKIEVPELPEEANNAN